MATNWVKQIWLFALLILLQVYIFNEIHIMGVITPLVYIYFILKLPTGMNRNAVLLLSFLSGFIIDSFEYTYGLHTLATTTIGFLRFYGLKIFSPRDMPDSYIPSSTTIGIGYYLRYIFSLVMIHHALFFSIETFSIVDFPFLLLKIFGSTALTVVIIFIFDGFRFETVKK